MFTSKGLKASLTFLEETGIATRSWLRGSKNLECDGGWRHADTEDGEHPEEEDRRGERAEDLFIYLFIYNSYCIQPASYGKIKETPRPVINKGK